MLPVKAIDIGDGRLGPGPLFGERAGTFRLHRAPESLQRPEGLEKYPFAIPDERDPVVGADSQGVPDRLGNRDLPLSVYF